MVRFLILVTFVFLNLPLNVIAEDTAKDRAKALINADVVSKWRYEFIEEY